MITGILDLPQTISFEKVPASIYDSAADASKAVADEIASLIRAKQRKGEKAVLGLSTGTSPKKVYAELIRLHKQERLSFYNVIVFNLDEYYSLQPEALQSYHRFMEENLFNHIDIDKNNCFIPYGGTPSEMIKLSSLYGGKFI